MKKNTIIGLLAICLIVSLTFAYLQNQRAIESEHVAKELKEKIETLEKQAEENLKIAEENYQKALREYERSAQLVVETKDNNEK